MSTGWRYIAMVFAGCLLVSQVGCQSIMRESAQRDRPAPVVRSTEATADQQQQIDTARSQIEAGEYESALTIFQDILAENPMVTTAYLGVGDIHLAQNDYDSAEAAFGRAARIEPRNFDAQFGHGLALQMLERFVDAVRAYHRALTIQPENPRANLNLATTFLQMDDAESALTFAEKAVRLDPNSGSAHANLGAVYENLDRNAEAIDAYILALEMMEASPEIMMNLVTVLAREKRYQEAANTAETLVKIQPTANAYERLGWARFRLRDNDGSIEAYRAAVEIDPSHWPSWNGIGVIALNRWLISERSNEQAQSQARGAFRQSLRINNDQPKVVSLMSAYNLL